MEQQLKSLIGQFVRIENRAEQEGDVNKPCMALYGTLEDIVDETGYYVRVNDGFYGPSGVTFHLRHVSEIVLSTTPTIVINLN